MLTSGAPSAGRSPATRCRRGMTAARRRGRGLLDLLEPARVEQEARELLAVLQRHEGLEHLDVEVRGNTVLAFLDGGRRKIRRARFHVTRHRPLWLVAGAPHRSMGPNTLPR